jgi:transcriptional regulator with XRE-family HTH domain
MPSAEDLLKSADQPPIVKDVARRIQARRKRLGLRQWQVAERMGEPVGTYSRWDNGANPAAIPDLLRIAKALRCTVSYLVGEIDEEEMVDQVMLGEYRQLPRASKLAVRELVRRLYEQATGEQGDMEALLREVR